MTHERALMQSGEMRQGSPVGRSYPCATLRRKRYLARAWAAAAARRVSRGFSELTHPPCTA